MRDAETTLSIMRDRGDESCNFITGEPDEKETLTSGSEGRRWKSVFGELYLS